MTWVVDASVAVKWFVDEVRSAEARKAESAVLVTDDDRVIELAKQARLRASVTALAAFQRRSK